jgi:hypothetical protein
VSRVVLNAAPAQSLAPEALQAADPLVLNKSEAEFYLSRISVARWTPVSAMSSDLAAGYGIPILEQLLEVASSELVIEGATVANKMAEANREAYDSVRR